MDATIRNLKPGQSAKISGDAQTWCIVERSGNGRTVRFVRCTPTTQTVFRTLMF